MCVHVFTCAAANYLPKVRVLFDSVRKFHPDWKLHLALADQLPSDESLPNCCADEIHVISDLDIPQWQAWTFCHSLVELATAIKPFMLRRLLARSDCDATIYLDPDVVVFSQLEDIIESLKTVDILLTPHQTSAATTVGGMIAEELCTLQHGVFNLGFVAVASRKGGRNFADWWARRTYHFCREDIPNGIYTDQRWIDLAPVIFPSLSILRSSRFNVAPWNLSSRQLNGSVPDALVVDGQPLGFFHFSAIDTNICFGDGEEVASKLADWYRIETKPTPEELLLTRDWRFNHFDNGDAITSEQRLVFRLRDDLQRSFPNPFRSASNSFHSWWQHQAPIEFPRLFNVATHNDELMRLGSALTTGYAAINI